MKLKLYVTFLFFLVLFSVDGKENIKPTVSPSSFTPRDEITIEFDVTGTPLADLSEAYIWLWVERGDNDYGSELSKNPASSDQSAADKSRFTKSVTDGKTKFTISFVPQDMFAQPICLDNKLGMLLKGNDWSNGQTEDHTQDMTALPTCYVVNLITPTEELPFVAPGDDLHVQAESSDPSSFTMSVDGQEVAQQADREYFSFHYTVTQDEGTYPVRLEIGDAENDTTIVFNYFVNTPSELEKRPAGVIPGINYSSDATTATLCLLAPGKQAVYALGEFNSFEIAPSNKMKRDGDCFWIELTGLNAGEEYGFQYLVDGVYVADPFADKILDPDDKYIPTTIYPNLKQFPQDRLSDEWYKNRLSVLQTGKSGFSWQNTSFQRPEKADLVIYELLMRDFFAEADRNYQNLIDTLSYLKNLGVNAIELMPIQEFSGNNSWGYNPNFMFAPDKAYGTAESLKEFIDAAHGEGIAVIMDVVFNQQEIPNPYVAMWYDYSKGQVTSENPMFNMSATHPFSVFIDMDHESEMTQYYMDTTLHYWVNEYKVDGFRFDLSKGFTQKQSSDVGQWGKYDQSRIDLLKRMGEEVWSYDPDSYLILEHFADNDEETALADAGFMLWGNMHWDYKDLALGVKKNISWSSYEKRGWENPNLVTYFESHDEQRMMYELLNFGKSSSSYNTQNEATAIDRIKLASALFYTIPGPKMLWQFGEYAYDEPINLCSDGTSVDEGCRTDPKPTKWNLLQEENRQKLYKVTQALIKLKTDHAVFKTGDFSITDESGFVKEISLANKDGITNPTSADEMSVYVIGNFDLEAQNVTMNLPFSGTWYDFFNEGAEVSASSKSLPVELKPGEFKLLVNFKIDFPEAGLIETVVTSIENAPVAEKAFHLYPNPCRDVINFKYSGSFTNEFVVEIKDLSGRRYHLSKTDSNNQIDISNLSRGMYVLTLYTKGSSQTRKFLKQ